MKNKQLTPTELMYWAFHYITVVIDEQNDEFHFTIGNETFGSPEALYHYYLNEWVSDNDFYKPIGVQIISATFLNDTPGGGLGYKPGWTYDLDFEVKEVDGKTIVRIDPRPRTCMACNVQSAEYDMDRFLEIWAVGAKLEKGYDHKAYPHRNREVSFDIAMKKGYRDSLNGITDCPLKHEDDSLSFHGWHMGQDKYLKLKICE